MTTNTIYIEKDVMNEEFGYDISGKANDTYDDVVISDPDNSLADHKKLKFTLNVLDINHNCKNSIGKFPRAISKTKRTTQQDIGYIYDYKKIDDSFILRIHLTDDSSSTLSAWDKYWIIRQMCANGGKLINFHYRGVDCNGSVITGSRINHQAFLTNIRINDEQSERDPSGYLESNASAFQASLTIVLGRER